MRLADAASGRRSSLVNDAGDQLVAAIG